MTAFTPLTSFDVIPTRNNQHKVNRHTDSQTYIQMDRQTDKSLNATLSLKLSVARKHSNRMCTTHFSDSRGIFLLIPYPWHDITFKLSINHPSPLHMASTVPTRASQHKLCRTQTNINVKMKKKKLSMDMKWFDCVLKSLLKRNQL